MHEEEVLGKAYDARLMRRLLGYLRPYKLQVAIALVAIIAASVLQLAQPWLMKVAIDRYIATGDLEGLDRIALTDGSVEIGALARHTQAERSAEIARHAPLIAAAVPHIGHPAIRNRGTIGGSIAFADPAAELPACLVALGAELEVTGPEGPRTIKADDFFKGLFATALETQDVLTRIRIPVGDAGTRDPGRSAGGGDGALAHG